MVRMSIIFNGDQILILQNITGVKMFRVTVIIICATNKKKSNVKKWPDLLE